MAGLYDSGGMDFSVCRGIRPERCLGLEDTKREIRIYD